MVNIFSKQSVLCTLCFSMQCVKHSVYRKQMFCTFCCYQGRIQKISEGVAVCRGGGDYGQKTVFKAYSRRQNFSLFVSTEKKLKNNFMRGWRSPDRLPLDPPLAATCYTCYCKTLIQHLNFCIIWNESHPSK
jgi:hypothetical protein